MQSAEVYFRKCVEIHGNKYSYTNSIYNGTKKHITIHCPTHGDFSMRANHHCHGQGCQQCSLDYYGKVNLKPESYFVEKAKIVHDNFYSYDNIEYKNLEVKINITCPLHGDFLSVPYGHLAGKGCPNCAVTGFKPDQPGSFYVLENSEMVKVGIANDSIVRLKRLNCKGKNFKMVADFLFTDGQLARDLETAVLQRLRKDYPQPVAKFDGYSECFYGVDTHYLLHNIIYESLQ